jgi:hypothetical protein
VNEIDVVPGEIRFVILALERLVALGDFVGKMERLWRSRSLKECLGTVRSSIEVVL